jgi:hypothetical protein
MLVKHIEDAKPYDAVNHRGNYGLRLQGFEPGGPTNQWVGLSHFLPGGGAWSVATAFAPVTYAPMPVLFFRRIPLAASSVGGPPAVAGDVPPPTPALYRSRLGALDQRAACGVPGDAAASGAAVPAPRFRLQLVGWGAAGGVNPDRIILKRTILSGFPVKVSAAAAALWRGRCCSPLVMRLNAPLTPRRGSPQPGRPPARRSRTARR